MGCASGFVTCVAKWVLFLINFLFALGGLAILTVGIMIHYQYTALISNVFEVDVNISYPATILIIVGAIIFIIAFFGCCGAIRESECMIITFAVIIMTLLVIQIAIAVFAFHSLKSESVDKSIRDKVEHCVQNYDMREFKEATNTFQSFAKCCGADGPDDYSRNGNKPIPYSCCGKLETDKVCTRGRDDIYQVGCKDELVNLFHQLANMMGTTALAIGAVEVVGIVFALCLANAIRHADRRGYKV